MAAGKMNAGTQKKKNTAHIPGFRFCRYEKSQLESMDKEQLVAIVLEQQEQLTEAGSILKEQEHAIRHITEQLNLRNADLYGPRSEKSRKLQDDQDKGGKDEPEAGREEQPGPSPADEEDGTGTAGKEEAGNGKSDGGDPAEGKKKKKGQPRRKEGCVDDILKDLNIHHVEVSMTEEELKEKFGTADVRPGPDKVYRTCRYIPGIWYVEEIHVKTVIDPESGKPFQPALAEDLKFQPFSYFSEDVLAYAFDQRFTMAVPFYRLEKWMERNRLYIKRQSMAAWAIRLDAGLFQALIERMWHHLLLCGKIQIDETPAIVNQVRKRDDEPTSLCYMWNFRTSELLKDIPAVIIFHFDESRGTEVLEECLPGYVGVIMSDGHSPYHGFAEKSGGTVTNAGCLNHARTRFARVLRANPELRKLAAEGRKEVPACKAIELFKKIFREERKLKDACPDDRLKGRQEKVRPVFEELSAYIKSFGADDFDQSGLMYDALQYFINQEKYLRGFLDDPLIPAHNSACERDNAGFAVLRNNIKFIDSISGAVATADLYSLAATAKAHNIDFFSYMRYVLKELPAFLADQSSRDYRNMEGLDAFLPWSPECRTKIEEEWDRRKEIVSCGSLFPREDMHQAVTKRLRALQAGQ